MLVLDKCHAVVQFYPWFMFYFPLFFRTERTIMRINQEKIKNETRIKLNHNIHTLEEDRGTVKV